MSESKISDLIFERWVASLASRDRSKVGMPTNFDDLFDELKRSGVSFDEARDFLPKAIKAHQPSPIIRKNTWKKIKQHLDVTENEFYEEWSQSIKNCATEAFFSNFPLKADDDDDKEPKVYGSMSAKEYKLQRKYAEAFPILNTDELERQLKERRELHFEEIDNILGDDDDTK